MAARLVVFRHFNRTVLQACFGSEGEQLEVFARAHSSAFVATEAENLCFADGVRPLLEKYLEAQADPSSGALREKVTRLWSERANELQAELRNATAGVARLEKDRDGLFKELEAARGQVVQRVQDHHKEWRSRVDEDVVRLGASLLANAAGVACFWIALFSANQRLTFAVLGAILIGIGIGTPAMTRNRKTARVAQVAVARRKEEDRVGQARGTVNLIEARIAGLQQRLAEDRRKLERLRAATEEPYV